MLLPNPGSPGVQKSYSAESYRYGFNGKESDDELHESSGTSYDFGERQYSSRIARFFSTDPFEVRYPWQSTYVFAANSPVSLIDFNGMGPEDAAQAESTSRNESLSSTTEAESKTEIGFANIGDGLRNVTITVTDKVVRMQKMKSYPEPVTDPSTGSQVYYDMPVYEVIVTGTDNAGNTVSKTFYATRFGVGKNEKVEKGDKYPKQSLAVIGLADEQVIYPTYDPNYKLSSSGTADLGGFRLGNKGHWLHDGPNTSTAAYGSFGCIELCGPDGFDSLESFIASLSGSKGATDQGKITELVKSGKIKVVIKGTTRPSLNSITPK